MSSPLDQVKEYPSKVEKAVSQRSAPTKHYFAMFLRFLIVYTFYEDAARLTFQWGDQNRYLTNSLGFPPFTSEIFLFLNVVTSLVCATLSVRKKYTEYAIGGLLGVVISQWLGYGMFFNLWFIFYNFLIVGGLLMLYAEHIIVKNEQIFTGITKFASALFIILFLSIMNVFMNYLSVLYHNEIAEDYTKYNFYQSSIAFGGFLLLIIA